MIVSSEHTRAQLERVAEVFQRVGRGLGIIQMD